MANYTVVLKDGTRHPATAATPQDAIRSVGASSTEVKYVSEERNWKV
jgi:hypothetical protein